MVYPPSYFHEYFKLISNKHTIRTRQSTIGNLFFNVGSVLWRLFSTLEVVQYIGGCSVHRGDNISTVGG